MDVSEVQRIMYPPSNMFIAVISVVSMVVFSSFGFQELRGRNQEYSKFWTKSSKMAKLSSRRGMLLFYTPAFLASFASFWVIPHQGFRILLLKSCLTIHFFKRIIEVLFVHKFSGYMSVETAIITALSYFTVTTIMIYSQYLTQGVASPSIDLMWPGMVLLVIGLGGNFYHHYLLSRLRSNNDREYKIPKGGIFGIILCPHYLFEILEFWGVSFISQTLFSYSFAFGSTIFLMGRSYTTRKWYLSKFEDLSKDVKALVPFVF